MKNKKTIRKLTPLARRAAKLSRAIRSTQRAIDNLCEEIATLEAANKALEKLSEHQTDMLARYRLMATNTEAVKELWPPDSGVQP